MAEEKDNKATKAEGTEAADKSAGKKPAAKEPAAKQSAAKKPAAKKPGAKKPGAKQPAAKKPGAKQPAAKKPAAKQSDEKSTTAKKPATKAKSTEKKDDAKAATGKTSADKPAAKQSSTAASTAPPKLVRATARYVRSSPRKARLVVDHIRGESVEDARVFLQFTARHVGRDVAKVLESAVANAEHNHELDADELHIVKAFVDEGPTLKRWRPRAKGRATQILKRTSHITVIVSDVPAKETSRNSAAIKRSRKATA